MYFYCFRGKGRRAYKIRQECCSFCNSCSYLNPKCTCLPIPPQQCMNSIITLNIPDLIVCTGGIRGAVIYEIAPVLGAIVMFSSDSDNVIFNSNSVITNENGQFVTTVTVPQGTDPTPVNIAATTTVNGGIISKLEITTISCPSVSSTKFLYATNPSDNTIEIFDIANSIVPVHVGDFRGGNLSTPAGSLST